MATDPVCGTTIEEEGAAYGSSDYRAQTYYFCALGCQCEFNAYPHLYADQVDERPAA
jgi:YHS domain-containing protein